MLYICFLPELAKEKAKVQKKIEKLQKKRKERKRRRKKEKKVRSDASFESHAELYPLLA